MKKWTIFPTFAILFCLVLIFLATTVPNNARASSIQPTTVRFQLCLVLDGSSSLTVTDWNTTIDGIANFINNSIPKDSTVELALVEFGYSSSDGYAKIVLTPTVVSNANSGTLASQVMALTQGGSGISTAAGIQLAWLAFKGSSNFANASSHVINLVTEYLPAVRNGEATSDLDGNGVVDARDDAIEAVVTAAGQGLNELDVEGVGMDNSTATWFQHYVVWPQVGIVAPPFSKAGWIRTVTNATEFANTISQDFPEIVPEFSSIQIIPLLIVATFLAVLIRKRKGLGNVQKHELMIH